jgi:F-type H+-transporting ATPase subunit gamma
MQSIYEIQNRLKGMEDIKHLLRSIRAMSAIRWRKAKQHLDIAQSYTDNVDAQLGMLLALTGTRIPKNFLHTQKHRSEPKTVGLITLTSERGLCGNFNTGLVAKSIHVTEIINRKNKTVKIISLGGFGERLFVNAGYEIFFSEKIPVSQAVSFVNIRKIIAHIRAFYESGAIDELNILHNQFNYFGSYTPKSVQILPPQLSQYQSKPKQWYQKPAIKGNPEELLTFLLWEHLAASLYLAYIESNISEHSARLQTMDTAISSLEERISDLDIQYHTIRQEKITQEVLEVQSNVRNLQKRR